ncbi:aldehyde dehydrogenase family protein [uncultured Amnibacterium sp.]|uniref:aldehyde dehydrogenase family protein n=1 Tax=uncultured Amnibacterium sp. TaxID=1631851 RepID=UPI0035CC4A71
MADLPAPLDPAEALSRAAEAAPLLAALPRARRAAAMVAAADALQAAGDELIPIGARETGLPTARLTGELRRTAVQLRLLADVAADGTALDVRLDEADPGFALGPRPDLRRTRVPLGPALVFAAGNFPFAFSVAGGDTAAALAAGCPVVVKAHPGHPELSRRTAAIVAGALAAAGLPTASLQLIEGEEAGVAALRDPRTAVASFTGSVRGGQALAAIAAGRARPIPFYGELGSVNPVFVTAAAAAERGEAIADGFVASVSGSAGQLCTKPGFLLVPEGHGLDDRIAEAAGAVAGQRLLSAPISAGYASRRDEILGADGVRVLADGGVEVGADGVAVATPTVVAIGLGALVSGREHLLDEAFGPLSVVVTVPRGTPLTAAAALFPGVLAAGVHLGAAERGEPDDAVRDLVAALTASAGRVLFDGWPTGVAVTPAMQHGGPWPSTTADATSVGTDAIGRYQRAVAYQDAPAWLLPDELRDGADVPQALSPAGASAEWGARFR